MKVLLDTTTIIHREASAVFNEDIGELFRWLDKLHYEKCIHPLTLEEIKKHKDEKVVETFKVKLNSYVILKTEAPLAASVKAISEAKDKTPNDFNDTKLINELESVGLNLPTIVG